MEYLAGVLFTLAFTGMAVAYPDGAPTLACGEMFPTGHKADAQNSDAPYTIGVSSNSYANSANITVTLDVKGDNYYEGVFIQARIAKCPNNSTAIGTYVFNNTLLKTINCFNQQKNALTHSTKEKKRKLVFTWVPPSPAVGTVYFRGTFVKETEEFWTDVSSDFISDGRTTSVEPEKCKVRTSGTGKLITAQAHYIICFIVAFVSFVTSTRMA
ncbi:putative defense protein 3 [Liolophura sinensis]|uniref:putative defense protein 3 n=1 Tax=Liolophura sinensis TaxID=3198878 RepID=UPI003159522C